MYSCDCDVIFSVGRAGYLSGVLWLNSVFGQEVVDRTSLKRICDGIVESGKHYKSRRAMSAKQKTPPLMYAYYNTEYLGAAHGLCAILQMLISVPGYIDQTEHQAYIKDSIDFLVELQSPSGNLPCAMDEVQPFKSRPEREELVHWCHGAPGTVYLYARAYLVWKDPKYLQAALKCGDCVWTKGLLRKGPGICHGVAGSGYVFLLLYR